MSVTTTCRSSFDYSARITTQKTQADQQVVAQVTSSMTSATADTYEGPTYSSASLGMSGVPAGTTINGVPIEKIADARMTTVGSFSVIDETSLTLSYALSGASGSKDDLELMEDSRSTSDMTLGTKGNSQADIAEQALREFLEQGTSTQEASVQSGWPASLGTAYDAKF